MLARDLTLNHIMDISGQSREKFKELNLILSSKNAWGILRKDLINALGVQRAKRFLIRYGYQCGKHEAAMLKKEINWKNEMEWLIAGTKMHNLTGRVFSYPNQFHVDIKKGTFNVSGSWLDSYEADQHLKHFPLHREPICFYLIGYASGYTSECMQKQTIFKEIKCRGKGDDYCSYQAKTVEEWGDNISDEKLFYENMDMSDELDHMYRKVEQQKEKLEIGYTLTQKLNDSMLQGEGFETFARILGGTLKCNVLLEDNNFEMIAFYKESTNDHVYYHDSILNQEEIDSNNMTVSNIWNVNEQITSSPYMFRRYKGQGLLSVPIMLKQQNFGYISINQENTPYYRDLLERVSTVATLYVQNERIALETEQRLTGDLLEQLLDNKEANLKDIENRFSLLGYDLSSPHFIFHIDISNLNENNNSTINAGYHLREKITEVLVGHKNSKYPYMLISTSLNNIKVIISKDGLLRSDKNTPRRIGKDLVRRLETSNRKIFIGISDEIREIKDYYKGAQEAKKAAEIIKLKGDSPSIAESKDLGYLSLLLDARDPEELKAYANNKLYNLIEYDKKRDSELLKTLFFYMKNEFNLHKTARKISISISGMRYRIQKIEELIGVNLSKSDDRFEIQLSLSILSVYGELST